MDRHRLILKKGEETLEPRFTHCLLDFFCKIENVANVHFREENGTLLIEENNSPGFIDLKHAQRCPMRVLNHDGDIKFITDTSYVKVAACVIIESSDSYALLTRRPVQITSTPNAWVFPGGHLEPGETAAQAAVREVKKETGLDISNCKLTALCFWEHVQPFVLAMFSPTHHSLIIYFHAYINEKHKQLMKKIIPNHSIVLAYCWTKFSTFNKLFTKGNTKLKAKQYYYEKEKWVKKKALYSTMFTPCFWRPLMPYYGVAYAVCEWKRKRYREIVV